MSNYWVREDAMLDYYDKVCGQITGKALAKQFNLSYTRANLLIRRHVAKREREWLHAKIEQLEANTFESFAERLWMDLEWLATKLERRSRDL
jgi:hypothetical protein